MGKRKTKGRDELTALMHSEFAISPEREKAIKVKMALLDMKDFNYSVEKVCELYGLKEGDFDCGK